MSLTAFIGRCPHCGHDHGENSLFDVARGTLTPAQQAKVNEQFANYAKQKPHLYGGCDEITTLHEQVKKLTDECVVLRASSRSKLETISSLELQVEKLTKERDESRKWAGAQAKLINKQEQQLAALAEQNEKMRKVLLRLACLGNGDQYGNSIGNCIAQEALPLPDLASPVLNRIRAEGMRISTEIHECEDVLAPVGNSVWGEAYQQGWIDGTAKYRDVIHARAAELEKSNG